MVVVCWVDQNTGGGWAGVLRRGRPVSQRRPSGHIPYSVHTPTRLDSTARRLLIDRRAQGAGVARIPTYCVRTSPRILTTDPRPQADAVSDPLSVRDSVSDPFYNQQCNPPPVFTRAPSRSARCPIHLSVAGSTAERRVPQLIPVLGSQPAGDVSHKLPSGPRLSSQPLRGPLPVSLLGEQRHDGCEQFA